MMENKQKASLIGFVTLHPVVTVFVSLLLCAALAAGVLNLTMKSHYRVYFGEENPQLQAFEAIQKTYNKSDSVLFVIETERNTVFTPTVLQAIKDLTKQSWQIPFSSRVDSLTNFQYTFAEGDDLIVQDLVQDTDLDDRQLAKLKSIAINEPFLVNRLVAKDGAVAGVNVTLQLPEDDINKVTEVTRIVRQMSRDLEAKYPGIKVYLTGIVMMNNAFTELAMDDNMTLVPLMYVCIILTLLLSLKSIMATISTVFLIILAVVSSLGIGGWLGWFLTPTSAIAPTIVLTMAVADCVHILSTQIHLMRSGKSRLEAVQQSLKINYKAVLVTSVTTAIGFLSMNFSDAPPFRDLGNLVAIGVIVAWLLSITFLPAMMVLLPVKVKIQQSSRSVLMVRLAEWVIGKRRWLLIINGLLACLFISFLPNNELNDEFVKYFDETTEFRQGTDFLNENLGGIYTIEFSIESHEPGVVSDPKYLQKIKALTEWLYEQPGTVHINSITDVFKRLNKNMHADQPEWYQLPDERDLAAQYLLLYEMSLPYGLDLNDQINIDKSGIRLITTLSSMSSNQMLAFEQSARHWLDENMNEYQVAMASPVLMFSHIGSRNIIQMVLGSTVALILISVLLMLAFRSFKLGLISLIPNLVPAGIAFGIWGLIDGRVGLGLSVVTGMTLGIVVDDTVHFISKYRYARLDLGMSSDDAIRYAFSTVGVALWITSIVLVLGFMILSLSHFSLNSEMGLMTAITLAVALLLDLFLLPPVLMSLERKQ